MMSAQELEFFREDVEFVARLMGATDAPPELSQFKLETTLGTLWIAVKGDKIACCFEDAKRAKTADLGRRLNPYSGKWNWHEGPQGLDKFSTSLYALIEKPVGPGARCVSNVLSRKFGLDLSEEEAEVLWLECRDMLVARELGSSAREMDLSTSGELDTLPREYLMDTIASVLAGQEMSWPCNGDSQKTSETFLMLVSQGIIARGYKVKEQ